MNKHCFVLLGMKEGVQESGLVGRSRRVRVFVEGGYANEGVKHKGTMMDSRDTEVEERGRHKERVNRRFSEGLIMLAFVPKEQP